MASTITEAFDIHDTLTDPTLDPPMRHMMTCENQACPCYTTGDAEAGRAYEAGL